MYRLLKRWLATLPPHVQRVIRSLRFGHQIQKGRFRPDEPEESLLTEILSEGDWILDIGANVGHYTVPCAQLVGPTGRVIAVEPVTETVHILASNVSRLPYSNVTILNVAASDSVSVVSLEIPSLPTGLPNFYQARVIGGGGNLTALSLPIDALGISNHVTLVKIDTEGHELRVVHGLLGLLRRDRPFLIVEGNSVEVTRTLTDLEYTPHIIDGSWNTVFVPVGKPVPKGLRQVSLK